MSLSRLGIVCVALAWIGACTDQNSATNLNPDGPPMIEQVRLVETYVDSTMTARERSVFAFGNHPMATSDDEHPVTAAKATGNTLRIIMDELLEGNFLEEIQCRGIVGLDSSGAMTAFDTVPVGATPDDIAKCSVQNNVLAQSCSGDHAVCLCHIDGGCSGVPKGAAVGVLDANEDGAADKHQFLKGSVELHCGATNVPLDLANSYWNPSGNQQVPAMGGFDALGPAIKLVPTGALPTNQTCNLVFASTVVDKQNVQVCAPTGGRPVDCVSWPPNGDPACAQSCNPGDVSQFSFKVQALEIKPNINDGDVGVDPAADIIAQANAPLDPATVTTANITVSPAPPGGYTVTLSMGNNVRIHWTTPLTAATMYTLTFTTGLTDAYGSPLPAPIVYHFTTA